MGPGVGQVRARAVSDVTSRSEAVAQGVPEVLDHRLGHPRQVRLGVLRHDRPEVADHPAVEDGLGVPAECDELRDGEQRDDALARYGR
jgi:hypothetical protein